MVVVVVGCPGKTWKQTIVEDLDKTGSSWAEAWTLAKNRAKWKNYVTAVCTCEEVWWVYSSSIAVALSCVCMYDLFSFCIPVTRKRVWPSSCGIKKWSGAGLLAWGLDPVLCGRFAEARLVQIQAHSSTGTVLSYVTSKHNVYVWNVWMLTS